jgi:hypothetical protein
MEAFTVFGLALFLLIVFVIVSMILNIAIGCIDEEVLYGPGYLVVMLILSVILALFFTQPENFGYQKIVSNNSVEQEASE